MPISHRILIAVLFAGVVHSTSSFGADDAALRKRAEKLHRESIVIDSHNDITSAMLDKGFQFGERGDDPNGKIKTQTDIQRMKAGGLGAEFFAIFVDSDFVNKKPADGGGAARRALDMIGGVYEQVHKYPQVFEMAFTSADIRRIHHSGKIAALMGIEGGHAIEDSLNALQMFYQLGVRYMTLTHINSNDWADSEADQDDKTVKHHNGLTDFGKQVVREMNRLGMMVDISHVADKTFFDVIETTRSPIIASHSSSRAIANHPRNMSDEMLRAVARNGGVVMVNYYDGFLDPGKSAVALQQRVRQKELARQFPKDPSRVESESEKWYKEHTPGKTPISVLMDHYEHIIRVAGIDHVGIGSDFDGAGGFPDGMDDISKLPNLTFELLKRAFTDTEIKKVLGENLLRVMAANERIARTR